jgi:hypothetical protein
MSQKWLSWRENSCSKSGKEIWGRLAFSGQDQFTAVKGGRLVKQGYIFAAAALAVVAVPLVGALDGEAFAQSKGALFGNGKGKTKTPPPPPPPPPPKATQPACPNVVGPPPGNSQNNNGNPTRPCNKSPK